MAARVENTINAVKKSDFAAFLRSAIACRTAAPESFEPVSMVVTPYAVFDAS
jgi:hypothetical protein